MALIDTNAAALAALVDKSTGDSLTAAEYTTLKDALQEANTATRTANTVFAGPASGAAAAGAFRALVAADIPTLSAAKISDFASVAAAAAPVQSVAGRTGAVTITAADVGGLGEAVDDRVAALLVEGTGITLTYDDNANTLTIDAAGGGGYTYFVESGGGAVITYYNTTPTTGTTRLDIREGEGDVNTGNYLLRFLANNGTVRGGIQASINVIDIVADSFKDTQVAWFQLDTAGGLKLVDTLGLYWMDGAPYNPPHLGLKPSADGILRLQAGTSGYGVMDLGVLAGSYTVNIAAGSDVGFVDVPVASGSRVGGTVEYVVEADDGTDFQIESGVIQFAAVNKAGTVTTTTPTAIGTPLQVVNSGTLTVGWAATAGASKVTLKVNAVSSLTETTLRIKFRVHIQSGPVIPTAL